ncbi:mandelate racemase/muconate lactonizing enzyme family protein [Elioraea sp. Yellowstone]|jgi:L-alanine-DL-glutamate epimerase-like enolase superfamily enzyme|uniref:mandelate racemase/muconate lactonizing enzyme family protein n=1 Tax=Elioraea sp. Yellowstone TaxID=2592070 RepID=UPI0011522710|nr:mandelate racemase/muconate lactonizing enzyme family protein [Elioraea sp. Yellowstone]TQF81636.1 mandelate racemase/muconate lactonizing enzyme family protein [Elioraea sp. Yellowstone]
MARIARIEISQIDLFPKRPRSDAIQAFTCQETPVVRIVSDDGADGIGYSYTIGTGGSSVIALLRDHLAPRLIGRDADAIEAIWQDLFWHTHALSVGPLTALALAAIDTALWDLRGRRLGVPLHRLAGGAKEAIPVYDTESGWLHVETPQLVADAQAAAARGFRGVKVKVGKPHLREDVARLEAVRRAIGDGVELMTDANQGFTVAEAIRRAGAFEAAGLGLAWYEEPLPAEDVEGHARLCAATTIPIAVGESLYHPAQFRDYLARHACRIVQVDVARIGGITPWLKVAHMAEAFNVAVCPHYLMELHLPLCCAVPNSAWLEHIPQLDDVTDSRVAIEGGLARASTEPGNGIVWNREAMHRHQAFVPIVIDRA